VHRRRAEFPRRYSDRYDESSGRDSEKEAKRVHRRKAEFPRRDSPHPKPRNICEEKSSSEGEVLSGDHSVAGAKTRKSLESTRAWVSDSGANVHLSGDKRLFVGGRYRPAEIRTAGNEKIRSTCNADITLKIQGKVLELKSVFYVPGLRRNLLSISRLAQDGWEASFGKYGGLLNHERKEVTFSVNTTGGHYFLYTEKDEN
jgi:hypothetical protein